MNYSFDYLNDVANVITNIPNFEKIRNKSIFLAGSTGMICSGVVDIIAYANKYLKTNIYVILGGRNKDKISERFRYLVQNLNFSYNYCNFDSTVLSNINEKTDYIIHGAGTANPEFYRYYPVETMKNNIIGLISLLEMSKQNQNCRLLYISSSEVYGNRLSDNQKSYKEEEYGYVDILNPRACYPSSKRAAETLCQSYLQEYSTDIVIARPGHIYGPNFPDNDVKASTIFTLDAINHRDIVMKSSGMQLRSYTYFLDCASAIIAILLNGNTGEAYNISNSKSIVTIRQLAEEFAKCGRVKVVYNDPTDDELKSYNLMSNSSLDSSKLELLNWKATFDLHTGVKKTIDYAFY